MSDEFTTNENGSKTPEETNFQDYTAPEKEIVQNETSQMTQEQPETSYGATSAEENPQPDNTAYAYGQTAYQQAYQSEQSQPNAYQQAYYGQTQEREQEPDLELPHWFLEFYLFLHLHAASIIFCPGPAFFPQYLQHKAKRQSQEQSKSLL